MADSPVVSAPLDVKEQPILDRLYSIRTQLELLKQDRSCYIKSQDVMGLYQQTVAQVERLNEIRTDKRDVQNRVDTVLDDCFQLISLSFMTVGKNHEAPAVYSAVSTVKRLLDHLKEAAFFAGKDLEAIDRKLLDCRDVVQRGKDNYNPHLITLLEARMELCLQTVRELQEVIARIPPDLKPIYEKLVSILRTLSGFNVKAKFPTKEVDDMYQQLKEIEADLKVTNDPKDERPIDERISEIMSRLSIGDTEGRAPGSQLVADLLTRCLMWVELMRQKQGKIDPRFQEPFEKLLAIRNKLERLSLTQAWSLRESDLWSYQRQLDRYDEARRDGNFFTADGQPADLHAQRTLLYLLRKSYSLIFQLIISSEPVSEALLPIYNQLRTLRKCLMEVKQSGGVSSPRELYPYSMKLNSIDNMRVDGKFMVGNDIPDGQGAVTQLLSECFDLAYELRSEAEAEESENGGANGATEGTDGVEGDEDDDDDGGIELAKTVSKR